MNSFDKVQCEETPEAQMYFSMEEMMEEMAVYQAWMKEQERKAQAELDNLEELIADELERVRAEELIADELDF